jgi:hypothetical protein
LRRLRLSRNDCAKRSSRVSDFLSEGLLIKQSYELPSANSTGLFIPKKDLCSETKVSAVVRGFGEELFDKTPYKEANQFDISAQINV